MKWSDGFFHLLGLEPGTAEPSYELLESLTHPADLRPSDELDRLFREGGTFEREFRIFHRDGRVRWVVSRGDFFANKGRKSISAMGILTDITGLQNAKAQSEGTQKRLSLLIEASSAVMWTLNADGYPGNGRAWYKLTGQTLQDTLNSGWLNAIHPHDRDTVENIWNSAVETLKPYKAEYRLRTCDGAYNWYRAHAIPVLNTDKSVREWLTVCFDIHDQKMTSSVVEDTRITGAQIRAARGIVNRSIRDVAEATNISGSTIRRLEEIDGASNDPEEIHQILASLRASFATGGVEFLFPFSGKPGIRPR